MDLAFITYKDAFNKPHLFPVDSLLPQGKFKLRTPVYLAVIYFLVRIQNGYELPELTTDCPE